MAITDEQNERLGLLLENLIAVRAQLTPSSQRFVDDQVKRHDQYGDRIFMSPKQWQWLEDLHREHCSDMKLPGDSNGETGDDDSEQEVKRDIDDEIPF
jgi:hypothetical protein